MCTSKQTPQISCRAGDHEVKLKPQQAEKQGNCFSAGFFRFSISMPDYVEIPGCRGVDKPQRMAKL